MSPASTPETAFPTLRVQLAERSYSILIVHHALNQFGQFLAATVPARRALFVTDDHVKAHADTLFKTAQDHSFTAAICTLPPGEAHKNLAAAATVYDALADFAADRQTAVVAVGGGVVGDVAGFAAATYARGLPLIMVPTTLLAMVDSAVGGKVGVNHPRGKNLIGAFHQPAGVWIDTAYLETLPDREYRSGLAEVVKYGVIRDAAFFSRLEASIQGLRQRDTEILHPTIARCCEIKAEVVQQDEREMTGLRETLNYGHTFAHAFETVGGYGTWLHGEAVAAGMICASRLAEQMKLIPGDVTERQRLLLTAFGLPTAPRPEWAVADLIDAMSRDKKTRDGRLRFILPTQLGAVSAFDHIDEPVIADVLKEVAQRP